MNQNLNGKRVAILVADGFEQEELTEPRKALDQAGATPAGWNLLRRGAPGFARVGAP